MKVTFTAKPRPDDVAIQAAQNRVLRPVRQIPVEEWRSLPGMQGRAARILLDMVENEDAQIVGDKILVQHAAAAALPRALASAIGLPPLAKPSATLSFQGRIDSADGLVRVRWFDPNARPIQAERIGAILRWGDESGMLSKPLFSVLEAIEGFNASAGRPIEERVSRWQPLQAALRQVAGNEVKTDGFLGSLTIYQAGAFALDVSHKPHGPDFVPILMGRSKRASLEDNAPITESEGDQSPEDVSPPSDLRDQEADALLTPELQKAFIEQRFKREPRAHDAYVLGRNAFVVLEPELKAALNVVHRKRAASPDERREFVRNPRPAIAEALGQDDAETGAASLFVETRQYSDRVLGLGIWEPPALPWLQRRTQQWLPETYRVFLGGRKLTLTRDRIQELAERVEIAERSGTETIDVDGEEHLLPEVRRAITECEPEGSSGSHSATGPEQDDSAADQDAEDAEEHADDRQILQIKSNIEGVEYTLAHPRRRAVVAREMPRDRLAATVPKPHQEEGFRWLLECWEAGWPGVLLADDMGLGKTFQALAFLAWSRANEVAGGGSAGKGPILVVAPTALLRNWAAEAELHLNADALGERVDAFGPGLKRLKRPREPGWTPEDALDLSLLRDAGWILTTYETLADNHRAFARIAYSVAVFDEMQKVKAPGTINTHAAKAINADFVLGLTGTPIENRLEDLWCIMDRVIPGYLGDLKSFSRTYGQEEPEALKDLKAKLDQPSAAGPPIMLRRMKQDILVGLPAKVIEKYTPEMPARQAQIYEDAVRRAREGKATKATMLQAIHALRGISLHPDGAQTVDPYDGRSVSDWIASSARLQQVVRILRQIERSDEKALVFIEDRAVQEAFSAAATTLFGLRSEPAVINGGVPGSKRQAIVDRFQRSATGFDLLVLSPKAAGVGLTITAANHVIHLSRWWNPAVEDQCNDRVYRIGQEKPVTIHVPMAIHPSFGKSSFDLTLDALLESKRALSRDMLAPPVSENDVDVLFGATTAQ